jgi:hypothetical protein
VNASASAGGSMSPTGAVNVAQGGAQTFAITATSPGSLTLQRSFEGFPLFQLQHSAFPVRLVGLVIASGMILQQDQNVGRFTFGIWQTALQKQACLRQGQGGAFF